MAGWTDSGSSRGRGGGGAGFANRGANNMNTRWRERRPAQPQQQQDHHQQGQYQQQHQQQHQQQQYQQHRQPQQQHRYRPVNDNDQSSQHHHQHHLPAEEANTYRGQGGFSTTARRPQPAHPPQPPPTFTDHKSPAPATNASANANASEPDDKARRTAANFECNVCFDMADDPVVTKCGHLFCWECLYQWLHVHSHHHECPVCKGQVADDAIIPIYGRGGSAASVHAAPPRPTGARVESSRQQQQAPVDWHMDMVDDYEDGFGVNLLTDVLLSAMPDVHTAFEDDDLYGLGYFDENGTHDVWGFPFTYTGPRSSRGHGHYTAASDDTMGTSFYNTEEVLDFVHHRGRHQHGRARGATYADRSSMVMGSSSSASYRDAGTGPHINNTGASSRPNGGWTERRGRSNRNSNSGGGGRGQNNSRRQGANYN